jgi:hypothetical protein
MARRGERSAKKRDANFTGPSHAFGIIPPTGWDATCTIVGTRGRGGFVNTLFGSCAEGVLRDLRVHQEPRPGRLAGARGAPAVA